MLSSPAAPVERSAGVLGMPLIVGASSQERLRLLDQRERLWLLGHQFTLSKPAVVISLQA